MTVRPPASRLVVMPAAASIEAMIQPPNISPAGLVSAGIASWRTASSPFGVCCSSRVVGVASMGEESDVLGPPVVMSPCHASYQFRRPAGVVGGQDW